MGPTQWRRSTHIAVGVAVVLVVTAVVVAAALTKGGHSKDVALPPAPAAATANPAIKPVADTAQKPTADKLAADAGADARRPESGCLHRQDHRR